MGPAIGGDGLAPEPPPQEASRATALSAIPRGLNLPIVWGRRMMPRLLEMTLIDFESVARAAANVAQAHTPYVQISGGWRIWVALTSAHAHAE